MSVSVQVASVSAGNHHSLVLTDDGAVLSFGYGLHFLGHGDEVDQYTSIVTPKVISELQGIRVVAVATGYYHSLVLTAAGEVFSFGYGRHGALGHGDVEDQFTIKWDDPILDIDWPIDSPILQKRDK